MYTRCSILIYTHRNFRNAKVYNLLYIITFFYRVYCIISKNFFLLEIFYRHLMKVDAFDFI